MKITLKDGTVAEAASAEELARFYKLSIGNGSEITPKTQVIQRPATSIPRTSNDLNEAPAKLLKLLYENTDEMDSGEVARVLGVSAKSIGGTVASLVSWGKRNSLEKRHILTRGRRSNGNGRKVRTMGLAKGFRKLIDEGGIRLKLDTEPRLGNLRVPEN